MNILNKYRTLLLLFVGSLISSYSSAAQSRIWDITPPNGFTRKNAAAYGEYLRNLPLKPIGTPVRLHDGSIKGQHGGAYAVIDMEIGKTDLQQCADAVMRLRAEYLWHNKIYDQIHFNFTNGFKDDYSTWAKGYRVSVRGNDVSWYKSTGEDYSYATFRKYMNIVFSYAGTASLSRELVGTTVYDLKIGDFLSSEDIRGMQ